MYTNKFLREFRFLLDGVDQASLRSKSFSTTIVEEMLLKSKVKFTVYKYISKINQKNSHKNFRIQEIHVDYDGNYNS